MRERGTVRSNLASHRAASSRPDRGFLYLRPGRCRRTGRSFFAPRPRCRPSGRPRNGRASRPIPDGRTRFSPPDRPRPSGLTHFRRPDGIILSGLGVPARKIASNSPVWPNPPCNLPQYRTVLAYPPAICHHSERYWPIRPGTLCHTVTHCSPYHQKISYLAKNIKKQSKIINHSILTLNH